MTDDDVAAAAGPSDIGTGGAVNAATFITGLKPRLAGWLVQDGHRLGRRPRMRGRSHELWHSLQTRVCSAGAAAADWTTDFIWCVADLVADELHRALLRHPGQMGWVALCAANQESPHFSQTWPTPPLAKRVTVKGVAVRRALR